MTINNETPINLAKAIVDPSIETLVDSLNLLGSTKIVDFFKLLNKTDKMKIIMYYSNIDPKIWFDLCKQLYSGISSNDILTTINSYNLVYYIENTDEHDIKRYITVASTITNTNNEYIKILQGKLEDVEPFLVTTKNEKLLNLYFKYCDTQNILKRTYFLFEKNSANFYNLIDYIINNIYGTSELTKNICLPIIEHFSTKGKAPLKNYTLSSDNYIIARYYNCVNIKNISGSIIDCVHIANDFNDYLITDKCVYKIVFTNDNYILNKIENECEWFNYHTITNYSTTDYGILVFDENCTKENTLFIENYYKEDIRCHVITTNGLSDKSYLDEYYVQDDKLYYLNINSNNYYDEYEIISNVMDFKDDPELSKLVQYIIDNFNNSAKVLKKVLYVFY